MIGTDSSQRNQQIIGWVLFVLGIGMVIAYMCTDREHLRDHAFLWAGIGVAAWGAHTISRQSVRGFLSVAGRFLPGGGKNQTGDHQTPGGAP